MNGLAILILSAAGAQACAAEGMLQAPSVASAAASPATAAPATAGPKRVMVRAQAEIMRAVPALPRRADDNVARRVRIAPNGRVQIEFD